MLTVKAIKDMQLGDELRDHVVKGLHIRMKARGASWYLEYYAAGDRRRPRLGAFPALTIELARDAARALLARVARGEDPSADRQARRDAATVDELCNVYLKFARRHNKPKSVANSKWIVEKYVRPLLGKRRVADVTRTEINDILEDIGETAPIAANRVKACLSKMFSLTADPQGDLKWRTDNPCKGALSFREHKRKRFAKPGELAALNNELRRLYTQHKLAVSSIYCMLYVGSRVTELVAARIDELVLHDDGTGRIEPAEHKTDEHTDRTLRLPVQAVAIVKDVLADAVAGETHIFGELGRCKDPRRAVFDVWDKARTAAGCPDLQLRDIRRTFASAAKSRGVSLDQIGELFDHQNPSTTKRYAWLFDDAARAVSQSTGDHIGELLEGPKALTND